MIGTEYCFEIGNLTEGAPEKSTAPSLLSESCDEGEEFGSNIMNTKAPKASIDAHGSDAKVQRGPFNNHTHKKMHTPSSSTVETHTLSIFDGLALQPLEIKPDSNSAEEFVYEEEDDLLLKFLYISRSKNNTEDVHESLPIDHLNLSDRDNDEYPPTVICNVSKFLSQHDSDLSDDRDGDSSPLLIALAKKAKHRRRPDQIRRNSTGYAPSQRHHRNRSWTDTKYDVAFEQESSHENLREGVVSRQSHCEQADDVAEEIFQPLNQIESSHIDLENINDVDDSGNCHNNREEYNDEVSVESTKQQEETCDAQAEWFLFLSDCLEDEGQGLSDYELNSKYH